MIESSRLTPTASREDLQRDDQYRAVQHALLEALIDGLADVAKQQPEAWRRVLTRHNEALLGAALCDERLFELLMEHVRVPTSQGDLPASALPARGAVHVISTTAAALKRCCSARWAYRSRMAIATRWCRSCWAQPGPAPGRAGYRAGQRALFRSDDSLDEAQLAWLREQLGDGEQLLPARFSPEALPVVVVPDREAELKQRLEDDENDKRVSMAALRLARQFTARIESRTIAVVPQPRQPGGAGAVARPARGPSAGRGRSPPAALAESHRRRAGRPLARANATPGPDLNGAFTDIAGALQQMLR